MSNFDASVRLGLDYRPEGGRRAAQGLSEVRKAAERLGASERAIGQGAGMASLEREARRLGASVARAETKAADLRRAAQALGSAQGADVLARNLKRSEDAAERSRQKLEALRQSVAALGASNAVEPVVDDMRKLGAAADAADRQVDELRKAADRLGRTRGISDAANEMEAFGRRSRAAGGDIGFMGGAVRSAGLALGAFVAPTAVLAGLDQLAEKFREVDRAAASAAVTMELMDPKAREAYIATNKRLGTQLGASQAQIGAARGVFKGAGLSDPRTEAATLDPTLRAAIAAGADAGTVAKAGTATINAFGIKPDQLGAAYDMMLKGTKLGTVELEDLARNLPSLGTQYAEAGGKGLGGLGELVALMEIAAKGAGSPDEAANNLQNYLSKLFSPETVTNFKKKGVNLPRLVEQARANGKHPAAAILDETQRLTGGDEFKMGQLFGDMQVAAALRPLMANRGLLDQWTRDIATGSAGTTQRDFDYMRGTPAGQEDQRRAEREVSQLTIGQAVAPGAAGASQAFTNVMKHFAGIADLWTNKGGLAAFEAAVGIRRSVPETAEEKAEGGLQAKLDALSVQLTSREAARAGLVAGGASDVQVATLTKEIEQLRAAIAELTSKLDPGSQSGASPISWQGGGFGGARLIPASLGGGGGGGGGGFRPTYGGAPVMDGYGGAYGGGPSSRGSGGGAASLGVGPGGVSATANPGGPAGEIFDVLSTSFNDAQSFALLGHMKQESELNPAAWNAREGAGGLLQWRGNRLDNLKRFASDRGMDWQDRKVQAAFIAHEMETDPYERRRSAKFRAATSVEDASAALADYVRFGDSSGGTRLANARGYAASFGARTGSGRAAVAYGGKLAPVTYANGGATRNRPITPELMEKLQRGVTAVYGEGYRAEIYSGGQAAKGTGGRRTGSTRHDDHGEGGMAADVYVIGPDGQRVTGDQLARLGQHWLATDQGGVGLEMRGGGIHLDQHRDRARHWNYAAEGGRYTRSQAAIMARGRAGIAPAYAMPGALDPTAQAEAAAPFTLPTETPASQRPAPRPGAGAGPGRSPSGPAQRPLILTQHFNGTDPRVQADRAMRAQRRSIKMAEARAMHDTAVPVG